MKTLIDDKDTYMPPFIVTLIRILQLYHSTSLVEFQLLQVEASCCRQSAICFHKIEEEFDFIVSPPAAGLLNGFRHASGGRSLRITGASGSRKVCRVIILRGLSMVCRVVILWCLSSVIIMVSH
jgi:hypothetical protein